MTPFPPQTTQLSIHGRPLAALRVTPRAVQASRAFTLSLPGGIALALRGVAGLTSSGAPVFGVDVNSVSPPPLVAAVTAGLLAAGKPLAGAKVVPLWTAKIPGLYDPWTALVSVGRVVCVCVWRKGARDETALTRSFSPTLSLRPKCGRACRRRGAASPSTCASSTLCWTCDGWNVKSQ